MKEAVDMTPEEYKKFIFQSGVKDDHGGGKIITMNADGSSNNIKPILLQAGLTGVLAASIMTVVELVNGKKVNDLIGSVITSFFIAAAVGAGYEFYTQKK